MTGIERSNSAGTRLAKAKISDDDASSVTLKTNISPFSSPGFDPADGDNLAYDVVVSEPKMLM